MLLILKIPLAYVCWIVWWAVKAEPEIGNDSEPAPVWKPWQQPPGPRPRRGGPHESPARAAARSARRSRKAAT